MVTALSKIHSSPSEAILEGHRERCLIDAAVQTTEIDAFGIAGTICAGFVIATLRMRPADLHSRPAAEIKGGH
jgi:hypothetical protein